MSAYRGFGTGSNSNGNFWFGDYGFLYKKHSGAGGRRNPKYGLICNQPTFLYNQYSPGGSGVGASSISTRRAKNRLATICGPKNSCGNFFTSLGIPAKPASVTQSS